MEVERALTQADKEAVFLIATHALPKWYGDKIKLGMTDAELTQALKPCLASLAAVAARIS